MSDPYTIIEPLWHGAKSVEVRTKALQELLLFYAPDHIHFREGKGYALKHKRICPGVYSAWLEEKGYVSQL